jgi:acetylornithine deacetylase
VPDDDEAEWEARLRAEVAKIEAQMKAVAPDAEIRMTVQCQVPGLRPEEAGKAETLVRQITGDNGTHVVSYGTEAGHFQTAGISSVVCGPGSIEQAHQADEFIALSEFKAGETFLRKLVDTLCV